MVSLADLRARNVVPSWQESVAVIQELIHTILATSGSARRMPDLERVALIANGDVVALPGRPSPQHPVRHAAVLLNLLLDGVPSPPELQAFVSRNLSDPPHLDTIEAFTRGLSFFEQPGRRADVERLVARAMEADAHTPAGHELARLKAQAHEATQPPKRRMMQIETVPEATLEDFMAEVVELRPPRTHWSSPERLRVMAAGVVVGVLGALLVAVPLLLYFRRAPAAVFPPQVAETAPAPLPPAPAGASSAESAGPVVGTERSPRPPEESDVRPNATRATPAGRSRAPVPDRRAGREAVPSSAPNPGSVGAGAARETPHSPPPTGPTTTAPAPPAMPSVGSNPSPADYGVRAPSVIELTPSPSPPATGLGAPSPIYTADDTTVTPAVMVKPALPSTPPRDVRPDQIGTIEVIVNEQGGVEQVRLISPANRYQERMIVAAAKMWKFRPAMKDGRPVKYRTRVRLTI
jgi:periplasmic protein TonB